MNRTTLILRNMRRTPRSLVLSAIGIVAGIASFVFFVSLGAGIRTQVIDRVFVADQVEVVPRRVDSGLSLGGLLGGGGTGLTDDTVAKIRALPGVRSAHPKQHLAFPAFARGGERLLGQTFWTELIADGIPEDLATLDREPRERLADRFIDWEDPARACNSAAECAPGATCEGGVCRPRACEPDDEVWGGRSEGEANRVAALLSDGAGRAGRSVAVRHVPAVSDAPWRVAVPATLRDRAAQTLAGDPGRIQPAGAPPCPDAPTWCDPWQRVCTMPVPVLASNTLLELYNSNVQTALGGTSGLVSKLPRLSADSFIGFGFEGVLGRGFLGESRGVEKGRVHEREVRLRLVGFSDRAIPIGATIPIGYVQRWNREFNGDAAARDYSAILVVSTDTKSLQDVAARLTGELGLSLNPRYEQAQKASLLVNIVIAVLVLLSLVIGVVAAINIMNTFLLTVATRRREIGVMRAVGATRGDILRLVIGEAALVGLLSTIPALLIAWGLMTGVDALLAQATPDFPFKPSTLFDVPVWVWPTSPALAVLFCAAGALLPAYRAATLDPAEAVRGR